MNKTDKSLKFFNIFADFAENISLSLYSSDFETLSLIKTGLLKLGYRTCEIYSQRPESSENSVENLVEFANNSDFNVLIFLPIKGVADASIQLQALHLLVLSSDPKLADSCILVQQIGKEPNDAYIDKLLQQTLNGKQIKIGSFHNHKDAIKVIHTLIKKKNMNLKFRMIFENKPSSSEFLNLLLECSIDPQAIERREGDQQMHQIALFIHGFLVGKNRERVKVVDVGAGYGGLTQIFLLNKDLSRFDYYPIETNRDLWEKIQEECKKLVGLTCNDPNPTMDNIKDPDIIFLINIVHELDLKTRITLFNKSLNLIKDNGVLVIHEVIALPKGEKDFYMWDGEDYRTIFSKLKNPPKVETCSTASRPGGWPLETITVSNKENYSFQDIQTAIVGSLNEIHFRWLKRYEKNYYPSKMNRRLKERYRAFLTAQVANSAVWKETSN